MEHLKRIIREYEEIPFEGLERGYNKVLYDLNMALTIIGPRRAGKTTYLREIIHSLQLQHYLFLNFEDERVLAINDLDPFIEAYYDLYHEKPHIFLDEIQNAEHWHLKVRRLIDQNYKVFITGSNANLLSSEIATHLAGRTFMKKIFPFTFKETLQLKKIPYSEEAIYGQERFRLKQAFREFLLYGGFPEVNRTTLKRELLRQYFEFLFYRDIIARYKIRQENAIRLLILKLVENISNSYQFGHLRNRIIQISSISRQSLYDYLRYLQESFFAIHIRNFQKSFMQRETERKTYLIDNGFITILSPDLEYGKLLENLFFTELLKRGFEIYYFKRKHECDFIVQAKEGTLHAFQVCWELNDLNREREINGLMEALTVLQLNQGTIITVEQDERIELDGKVIDIIPAWKWCLLN